MAGDYAAGTFNATEHDDWLFPIYRTTQMNSCQERINDVLLNFAQEYLHSHRQCMQQNQTCGATTTKLPEQLPTLPDHYLKEKETPTKPPPQKKTDKDAPMKAKDMERPTKPPPQEKTDKDAPMKLQKMERPTKPPPQNEAMKVEDKVEQGLDMSIHALESRISSIISTLKQAQGGSKEQAEAQREEAVLEKKLHEVEAVRENIGLPMKVDATNPSLLEKALSHRLARGANEEAASVETTLSHKSCAKRTEKERC